MISCPICPKEFKDMLSNDKPENVLQHHLWGAHNIEVIKSHDIAKRFLACKMDEQEILELKQVRLPL